MEPVIHKLIARTTLRYVDVWPPKVKKGRGQRRNRRNPRREVWLLPLQGDLLRLWRAMTVDDLVRSAFPV